MILALLVAGGIPACWCARHFFKPKSITAYYQRDRHLSRRRVRVAEIKVGTIQGDQARGTRDQFSPVDRDACRSRPTPGDDHRFPRTWSARVFSAYPAVWGQRSKMSDGAVIRAGPPPCRSRIRSKTQLMRDWRPISALERRLQDRGGPVHRLGRQRWTATRPKLHDTIAQLSGERVLAGNSGNLV